MGFDNPWITKVYEDRSETLWFGRFTGVSSYDGLRWVHYDLPGAPVVRGFADAPGGGVWVATGQGLFQVRDGQASVYEIPGLTPNPSLNCALSTRSGDVWIGVAHEGAMHFDGAGWDHLTAAEDGLAGDFVSQILEDRTGDIWFACNTDYSYTGTGGITRLSGSTLQSYNFSDGVRIGKASSLGEDEAGHLWAYTDRDLVRLEGDSFASIPGVSGDLHLVERNGRLWIRGGYLAGPPTRFDGYSYRTYRYADGLFYDQDFKDLYQDRVGNIWVATRWGLARFDEAELVTYAVSDSFPQSYVNAFFRDRAGGFWVSMPGSGVTRLQGAAWTRYTAPSELATNSVHDITQDHLGRFWFACVGSISRYDESTQTWTSYGPAEGLPAAYWAAIEEDVDGSILAGGDPGVRPVLATPFSRFNGSSWSNVPLPPELTCTACFPVQPPIVNDIHVDRSGAVWIATNAGLGRLDAVGWSTFETNRGFVAIAEDSAGTLWFASDQQTAGGVRRYDHGAWSTFGTAEGLVSSLTTSVHVDRRGDVWVGTTSVDRPQRGGVSRFDGERWRNYTTSDGLPVGEVNAIAEDAAGNIWLAPGFPAGPTRLAPDLVAPQTVYLNRPPLVSGSRAVSVAAVAGFGEADGIEFRFRLDGQGTSDPWSPWSTVGSWSTAGLSDGAHAIEAQGRDIDRNIDQTPAIAHFIVDATPPTPTISEPPPGAVLQGVGEVDGTTLDPRFKSAAISLHEVGSPTPIVNPPGFAMVPGPVTDSRIATWDTRQVGDGVYDLEVSVTDSLGLIGAARVRVTVDNHYPPAEETAPAEVVATHGGDIFTNEGDFHLYFAPGSFSSDTRVNVVRLPPDSIPDPLPTGAHRVGVGYRISWESKELARPARAEQSLAGLTLPTGSPAFYHSADGIAWSRVGGTVDGGKLQLPLSAPGLYALFTDTTEPAASGAPSGLTFTPRVFSPTGTFADRAVGIGFSLPRGGTVTVRVFSRSGRLIREVVRGQLLTAGANLVRWDGRDETGGVVFDGIYIVTVEALGSTLKETLAVVR